MTDLMRILLVEDNPSDASLLQVILEDALDGVDIAHVERLQAAIDYLAEHPIDVVLLDLSLPDAHGLDTYRMLREAQRDIPTVILSGLNDENLALQAVAEGAQDYLSKSSPATEGRNLARAVRYALARKHLESRERDQAMDKVRIELLGSIIRDAGHDLKTPISTLQVSIYLLDQYLKDIDPKAQIHLHKIKDQTARIEAIVQRMIEMSNLDMQNTLDSVVFTRIDVIDLLQTTQQRLAPTIEQSLDLELEDGNLYVDGEWTYLTQALNNLIENAARHSSPDSHITLVGRRHAARVLIEVIDSGEGIPQKDLPHIFDRFYRVDKSRNTQTGGSGLGLSIVQRVVELHHGHVEVTSVVGEGSCFRLVLPPHEPRES